MASEVGSRASVTTLRTHLRQMRAGLVELGVESSAVKSSTINDSDNMLMRIEFLLNDTGLHYTAFFTAPDKPAASGGSGTAATGSDSGGGSRGSGAVPARAQAGPTLPAAGLCLEHVEYDADWPGAGLE